MLCFLLFSFGSLHAVAADPDRPEAPLVGRQEPFCGGISSGRFHVSTSATPTHVQAGDPILFTVRIEAVGPWRRAPQRPDLQQKAEYSRVREKFHVANAGERLSPQEGKWEFDFSLRPKNERVREIPSLYIVYFRPGLTPPEKGYMTTSAPAILLRVAPRAKVEMNEVQGKADSVRLPDRPYQIITGSDVLQRENQSFPQGWLLLLLVSCPPIFSMGWYVWHTHRTPGAGRRNRVQKSRAARQALQTLQSLNGTAPREAARRVAEVVEVYLHHRFNRESASQPTASGPNRRTNEFETRLTELLRKCDSVRYAPPPTPSHEALAEEAADLILGMESRS